MRSWSTRSRRGVGAPDGVFDAVAGRLGSEHPVLTRAVLATRLVAVAGDHDLPELLNRLGSDPQDYFHEFVGGLVEREARLKWLDTSGDPPRAILTNDEHHELLAMLAQEMWLSATDELKTDVIGILVEMFADAAGKTAAVRRQIGERIKQHALLVVRTGFGRTALAFDHEDFRLFYLGQALGGMLVEGDHAAVRSAMEKGAFPVSALNEAVSTVRRHGVDLGEPLAVLQRLADGELSASFVLQNCGALATAFLDGAPDGERELRNMSFPAGALERRRFKGLKVSGSYFHATSLAEAHLCDCAFLDCDFERIELTGSETVSEVSLDEECNVASVVRLDAGDQFALFDPARIRRELRRAGFEIGCGEAEDAEPPVQILDDDLRLVQRFLRGFLRATAMNETTVRQRLGVSANPFFKSVLPRLIQARVVEKVHYQGHGDQMRLRLSVPMATLEQAMSAAGGRLDRFVEAFRD